ncbi:DNA-binding response regulator [Actinomadura sp. DC4]|uniref:helix-turn-helix transcriptional regulator n=1 Tax=Actinomadura sp. DC4 TaxID=3055069 RepID=UPI0025B1F867|nr:DNA-binding response regulator [Actinomadura sp. DC4]MDN3358215.1 DNA-binding response regulator [Actinomadura sp. DC4]
MPSDQVFKVRGEAELAQRAGHLFSGVKEEFLCAATDMNTWSQPGARTDIATRMRTTIQGGVSVRKLYTSAALAEEVQRTHLLQLLTAGAQVRICDAGLPHETIIIDRRVMILAGLGVPGDREFTVTTSPALIDGVYALYDASWHGAVPLPDRQDLPMITPDVRAILRTLSAGLTDEAAARSMGISLRTYRRRVAELMKALDSDSRFQAGLRAGELGLTS